MTVERQFELTCGHCKAVFMGSYKRHWIHQRGSPTYCADACRLAASSQKAQAQAVREGKTLRKGVLAGPCNVSREAREHQKKARALHGSGPTRTCKGCASDFVQSTPFGRALYCSVECRTVAYAKKTSAQRKNASHVQAP